MDTTESKGISREERDRLRAEGKAKAEAEQLVVPHWPRKASVTERIGNQDYPPVPGCDSVWIYLRTRSAEGRYGKYRHISNVGIYLWFSSLRRFQISVRAHNILSADERELEETLKLVKLLGKKVPVQMREGDGKEDEKWEPLSMYLPRLMAAFGITHCLEYQPGAADDEVAPVYLYLEDLNKDIQRRVTRMARV
jgi:hypothetical protein